MDTKDFMPDDEIIASIRKNFEGYESERLSAHRQVMWRVPLFLILLMLAVALIAWGFNDFADPYEQWRSTPHLFLYGGGVVAAFFLYSSAMSPATRLQKNFRQHLLPTVFGFIQDVQYSNGATPLSFQRLPRETVGAFNREEFDDLVTGRYADFPFELYEMKLRHKVGKSDSTVFKGVVVAFETAVPFSGLLIATRKSNMVSSFFKSIFGGGSLEEVQSGVDALDTIYDFRTNNIDAALPLVQGRLAQALKWLGEAWPEEPARIALHENDGFLLLPVGKNFFELPSISVPLDYDAHVQPIIRDMASLLATAALVRKISIADEGRV